MQLKVRRFDLALVLLTLLMGTGGLSVRASDIKALPGFAGGGADWVSREDGRIAYGHGREVTILEPGADHPGAHWIENADAIEFNGVDATLGGRRTIQSGQDAESGLLLLNHLVVAGEGQIFVLDLSDPTDLWQSLSMDPQLSGKVRLARFNDDLIVGDAIGIRRFEPFREHRHGDGGHAVVPSQRRQTGFLPTSSPVLDLGSTLGDLWVLTGGSLARVQWEGEEQEFGFADARQVDGDVSSFALNGEQALLVGTLGLRWIDLANEDTQSIPLGPYTGSDVELSGRLIELAAGDSGVLRFEDRSNRQAIIAVTVSSFNFTPSVAAIQSGDTVRWTNTGGNHNTESCDGVSDPVACGGLVAPEVFTSGAASAAAWVFSHTFTTAGAHPYFCVVHAGFGMSGRVQVAAPPAAPPTVPDGQSGALMRAASTNAAATILDVSFDDGTCTDQPDHQIVYGFGSQLPTALGGALTVAGSACGLGASSPATWTEVPDPATDPSRLLWFVVVSTDGGATEGGWSSDSAGTFRGSSAADGNSGQCGVTARSLTNVCGQ